MKYIVVGLDWRTPWFQLLVTRRGRFHLWRRTFVPEARALGYPGEQPWYFNVVRQVAI